MQRHGAQVHLQLLLPLHEGFLPPHLSLNLSSTLYVTHARAVLLLLAALLRGANLLGGAAPRVVGYIAVPPSAAAGHALPEFHFALLC